MPEVCERLPREVEEALSQGRVSRFEDYHPLLESYAEHAGMAEGQEAFGVQVMPDGAVVDEAVMTDDADGLGGDDIADEDNEVAPRDQGAEPSPGDVSMPGLGGEYARSMLQAPSQVHVDASRQLVVAGDDACRELVVAGDDASGELVVAGGWGTG